MTGTEKAPHTPTPTSTRYIYGREDSRLLGKEEGDGVFGRAITVTRKVNAVAERRWKTDGYKMNAKDRVHVYALFLLYVLKPCKEACEYRV